MTATLLATDTAPVRLRPVLPQPNLRKWLDELNFWQQEVKFYQQLLRYGIHSCKHCNRQRLATLLLELGSYREAVLPRLGKDLNEILSSPAPEHEAAASLQKRLERHAAALKKIKVEIFPLLYDLQPVTIH